MGSPLRAHPAGRADFPPGPRVWADSWCVCGPALGAHVARRGVTVLPGARNELGFAGAAHVAQLSVLRPLLSSRPSKGACPFSAGEAPCAAGTTLDACAVRCGCALRVPHVKRNLSRCAVGVRRGSPSARVRESRCGPRNPIVWPRWSSAALRVRAPPRRYHALLGTAVWRALQSNRANANNTPRWDEGAVAGFAAHTLLTHWFPWTFSRNDLLLKAQIANLSVVEIAGARQLGEAVANRVTGGRNNDGWARYVPGVWAPANETGSIGRYQQTPGQTCESSDLMGNHHARTTLLRGSAPLSTASASAPTPAVFQYPHLGLSKPILLTTGDAAALAGECCRVLAAAACLAPGPVGLASMGLHVAAADHAAPRPCRQVRRVDQGLLQVRGVSVQTILSKSQTGRPLGVHVRTTWPLCTDNAAVAPTCGIR